MASEVNVLMEMSKKVEAVGEFINARKEAPELIQKNLRKRIREDCGAAINLRIKIQKINERSSMEADIYCEKRKELEEVRVENGSHE